mgnify:CR=1 FL=1
MLEAGIITKEFFNQGLQSYLGVLKHCHGYKIKEKIISFIDSRRNGC